MKRFLIKSANLSVNTPVKKVRNTLSLECGHMDEDDPIPSTSFTAVQHENKNTSTVSSGCEELSKTSYLFDGELYTIVSVDGIKISAKCTACSKVINGHASSTGNFLSHIKVHIFYICNLFIYCYNIYN